MTWGNSFSRETYTSVVKGLNEIFVNKDKDKVTNVVKFSETFVSYWHVAYNFFGCRSPFVLVARAYMKFMAQNPAVSL